MSLFRTSNTICRPVSQREISPTVMYLLHPREYNGLRTDRVVVVVVQGVIPGRGRRGHRNAVLFEVVVQLAGTGSRRSWQGRRRQAGDVLEARVRVTSG